jgi:UDP-N-acetylglucosamine--N-acetylmuramyl-(pentapeptide) pyrophosphoryl-undecaprenol N-acetylglucosamine transferase
MQDLLAAADLIVARAGAVSIAEYAAAGVPAICLPYPYHKDAHQYKNASKLAGAGAAVIVRDTKDTEQTAKILCKNLINLMQDDQKLRQMARAAKNMANLNAAEAIARELTYL